MLEAVQTLLPSHSITGSTEGPRFGSVCRACGSTRSEHLHLLRSAGNTSQYPIGYYTTLLFTKRLGVRKENLFSLMYSGPKRVM